MKNYVLISLALFLSIIAYSQDNPEQFDFNYDTYTNIQKGSKWAIFSESNQVMLTDFIFDKPLEPFSKYSNFVQVNQGSKIGLAELNPDTLKIILTVQYDNITNFTDGDIFNVFKDGKMGIWSSIGDEGFIVPCIYDDVEFYEPFWMFITKNNNLYGYISSEKTDQLDPILLKQPGYEFFENFQVIEGLRDGKNLDCQFLLLDSISSITNCFDKLTPVNANLDYYYFTENGKIGTLDKFDHGILIPAEFISIIQAYNDLEFLTVNMNNKHGKRQYDGLVLIPEIYDELIEDTKYNSDLTLVKMNEKWGVYLYDTIELKTEYEVIELTKEYILLQKNGKWGALNYYFEEVKPIQMDNKKALLKSL